jgi:hypothetical protein
LINTEHPRRLKAYSNGIGKRKLDAVFAAEPDLRYKFDKALSDWRTRQQQGGSIVMDDGNPPTRPTANTIPYMIRDSEHVVFGDDWSNNDATQDDLVNPITNPITNTIADDSSKPEDDLYTAVSKEEDIDKLSNR